MTTEISPGELTPVQVPRPTQGKVRAWAQEHGIDVPPKGKISNATWEKWDAWFLAETQSAFTKLTQASARAQKAYDTATAHVRKHFED